MDSAFCVNLASVFAGLLSTIFWFVSAIVKAPPPPGYEGVRNADTWKAIIVDGGELYGTLRLQSKWNSRAAFAAAVTVLLQLAANMLSV